VRRASAHQPEPATADAEPPPGPCTMPPQARDHVRRAAQRL